ARAALAEQRQAQGGARSALERLLREAEVARERAQAIERERASWQRRAVEAERFQAELAERVTRLTEERRRLAAEPAAIGERQQELARLIDEATLARRDAGDRLAEGEERQRSRQQQLRAATATLAEAREARVRAEGGCETCRHDVTRLVAHVEEKVGCPPDQLLEAAEIDPGAELPERPEIEAKLQRLIRERENIGPVNLRAEHEAGELETRLGVMVGERTDLVAAIARLRQGISSLNREGRERLLAAFEQVNQHFGELFVRLFGGGRAHLALTEAEDPLEAGLEIMASPPGKRLTVLSLLSGGEQALTALALLFAVFLTNPAPICVLDEVDAPLDDANVDRFCSLVDELAAETQTRFIIITHHRLTMARVDRLYGVTMAERGISQLVSVDLQQAERLRESA
ncbi:MAG TPA: chromosome partitioning protein ParA, partial [Kiloniellales bacterium]|nr:chromosome partitioning protein ParA [Kiloniellales bacterium]